MEEGSIRPNELRAASLRKLGRPMIIYILPGQPAKILVILSAAWPAPKGAFFSRESRL